MDLSGVVDLHLHTGPDVRARRIDDLGAARAALTQRMGGVLFKNHHTPVSSDLGQPENPSWPDGYAAYLDQFLSASFTQAEMDVMCRRNPSTLLGATST